MIEYWTISSKKIQKTNIKYLKKLGQALDIARKPLMGGIFWRWLISYIFKTKVGGILNFESLLSLEINFKF